jgi:hypothetical protein
MLKINTWKGMNLNTPANYRIRVQGHLDDSWAERLDRLVITRAFSAQNKPITILVGHLPDQAALSNVLNALYELRLPLLSVENMDRK